jgi:hypothetical protein
MTNRVEKRRRMSSKKGKNKLHDLSDLSHTLGTMTFTTNFYLSSRKYLLKEESSA